MVPRPSVPVCPRNPTSTLPYCTGGPCVTYGFSALSGIRITTSSFAASSSPEAEPRSVYASAPLVSRTAVPYVKVAPAESMAASR